MHPDSVSTPSSGRVSIIAILTIISFSLKPLQYTPIAIETPAAIAKAMYSNPVGLIYMILLLQQPCYIDNLLSQLCQASFIDDHKISSLTSRCI